MMPEWLQTINWKKHSPGLLVLLVAGLTFFTSLYLHGAARHELQSGQMRLRAQQQQNIHAENQLLVFNEYFPLYQNLQQTGLVGNKNRLHWLETLRHVGEDYGIPGLSFTLENERPAVEVVDHAWHPDLGLSLSTMSLTIKLLHEGDWYRLLQGLRAEAKGVFSVEECQLRNETTGADSYLGGLYGTCLLEWYSLKDLTADWPRAEGTAEP